MEAAGFAAAIVAFIDFSYNVVKGSYDLYQSPTGTSEEHVHIDTVVKDLAEVTKGLNPDSLAAAVSSRHRQTLQQLALKCQKVAEELTRILEDLKRKDGNKAWRSLEAKWKSLRQESTLASLEKRLDKYQAQIMIRMQLILEEKQDAVGAQMEAMSQSNFRTANSTKRQLNEISSAIQKLKSQVTVHIKADNQSDSTARLVNDLKNMRQNLAPSSAQTPADIRILNRLYFTSMSTRQETIVKASYDTFKWFLAEEPPTLSREYTRAVFGQIPDEESYEQRIKAAQAFIPNVQNDIIQQVKAYEKFHRWLKVGGAFHISGRAGSGKSTLMRCLSEDPRLMTQLEQWADGKKLVFASFFFHLAGDKEQKSLSGFYRSILFSVLAKCSHLIKDIFAFATPEQLGAQWQDQPFSYSELREALENLIEGNVMTSRFGDYRFCFFIDGLDEYDGDFLGHFVLAAQLKRWATSPAVRIVVSSRPHDEFLNVFDEGSRIHLHQATSLDVLRLIHGNLREEGLHDLLAERSLTSERRRDAMIHSDLLAGDISTRANGVFLWVSLALSSIHRGRRHQNSIQLLRQDIQELPTDLETLFGNLLQGVRSEDRQLSAKLLLLLTSEPFTVHRRNFTLIMVSYIDDLDAESFPFSLANGNIPVEEIRERFENGRCLLQSLTMGLFESKSVSRLRQDPDLPPENWSPEANSISPIHSSVLEYLRTPEKKQALQAMAGSFAIHGAFTRLRLATLIAHPIRGRTATLQQSFRRYLKILFSSGTDQSGQISVAAFDKVVEVGSRQIIVPERDRKTSAQSVSPNHTMDGSDDQETESDSDSRPSSLQGTDFLSYLAAAEGQVDVVLAKVRSDKSLLSQDRGRLNLLFTACYCRNMRLVAALLNLGASPMDEMVVYEYASTARPAIRKPLKVTVWTAFIWTAFAEKRCFGIEFDEILGSMLQRDPDGDIIVCFTTESRPGTTSRSITLSLESMLKLLKPTNMSMLLAHIEQIRKRSGGISKNVASDMGPEAFELDDFRSSLQFHELQIDGQVLRQLRVKKY